MEITSAIPLAQDDARWQARRSTRTAGARLWGRTNQRTALTVGAIDAGGIEPFMPRLVSVRLPDGPVNAVSELRDGRGRGFGGWLAQRSGMDLHVRRLVEREDEL